MVSQRQEEEHGIPGAPPFEYDRIDDQVYIGTNACCTGHFEEELLKKGVTIDISLEGERIDYPAGVEAYLWLPTIDDTPPDAVMTDIGICALEEALKRGKKVFIHCKNGHGRAPTFYAAYLIIKKGMAAEEAVKAIRDKRPAIHLEKSQMEFLEGLNRA